jgi:hypothetical protein
MREGVWDEARRDVGVRREHTTKGGGSHLKQRCHVFSSRGASIPLGGVTF